jgi:drug/metabolite transporter (DMT)-like permease
MPLKTLAVLILCNLIWSAQPVAGKVLLETYPPGTVGWFRYASALAGYLLAAALLGKRYGLPWPGLRAPRRPDVLRVTALGLVTFCYAPLMYAFGLNASRAMDSALLVAMEPLMTVLLAWLLLGERVRPVHGASFLVALTGFSLLSGLSISRVMEGLDTHAAGNLILLAGLLGEAAFSPLASRLTDRYSATAILATALTLGACALTLALAVAQPSSLAAAFSQMPSWRGWIALFWLGPLGSAGCYLLWLRALRSAPISAMVVTLFVQPLAGALWGAAFLDERLTLIQAAGGALILLALAIQTLPTLRKPAASG